MAKNIVADKDIIQKIATRKGELKTERTSFISHWQEINKFISPRSARFLRSDVNKGYKRQQEMVNETVLFSRRTFESGLMAGMSSAVRPWFGLGPPDPGMKDFAPVKAWLDTVIKSMREQFVRSNVYAVLPKAYGCCGDYGTAAFGIQEDQRDVFRCYPFPIGTFMISTNDRMLVDVLYREFSMTVRQLVEKFGLENVSTNVRNLWDKGSYSQWVPVIHAMEPNFARMGGKLDSRDKAFLSVYYEDGGNENKPLRIAGFDDFPAIVPRFYVNGEDSYGTDCPGMMCLGSQKALQLEERRKYQGIDKMVNPPVNVDATLRNVGANLLPGGTNFIAGLAQSANAGIRPVYQVAPQLGDLKEDIKEVEARIRRAYYEDIMLMLAQSDNPQMTAREIDERSQEKLLVLGPLMEQFNDDLFDPLIDRTFSAMMRRGMFPPPPEELQGKPLRVEYTSIMAQAQKLVGVASVERFIGFVTNMATTTQHFEILHNIDFDETVREYGDMTGVTSKLIRPADVVKAQREEEAKAQQQQAALASLPALSQGATAVKNLSETNVEGVRDLAGLMTGMGGGVANG